MLVPMDRITAARLLGVSPRAATRQVERAFRKEVAVSHPDRFPPGSEAAEDASVRLRALVEARAALVGEPPPPQPARPDPVTHPDNGAAYLTRDSAPGSDDQFRSPADTDRLARAWGLAWGSFLVVAAVVSYVVGAQSATNDALPIWSPALALIGAVSLAIGWRAHRRLAG
jgi:hypothetical protein